MDEDVTKTDPAPGRSALCIVWCVFLLYSFTSTPIPGVNEPHYLCKARAFVEPDWCQRDFFLTSGNAHFCFYAIVGPFTRFLPLDAVAAVGRLISLLIIAIGFNSLGRAAGLRTVGICLAAAATVLLSSIGSLSGEWTVGGFESKVPAWGFALWAIACRIRSEPETGSASNDRRSAVVAGVLAGLAISAHPVVGVWSTGILSVAELLRSRRNQDRANSFARITVLFLVPCVASGLPGLIPALRLLRDSPLEQSQNDIANFIQVFWRLKHHLDPTQFSMAGWVFAVLLTLTIVLVVRSNACLREEIHLLRVLGVAGLIAVIGVMIGWHVVEAKELDGWAWRASLLKFYPFRLFDGLLPITCAVLTSRRLESMRWFRDARRTRTTMIVVGAFVAVALAGGWTRPKAPGGYNREQFRDWRQVCNWIRNNTPTDSLFYTPRESCGFKWFAERAEFVTYKDCPQNSPGILEWNRRFWYLHHWTKQSSSDGRYDTRDLEQFRRETSVDYIVTRILGPFEIPPIYTAGPWKVFAVPR